MPKTVRAVRSAITTAIPTAAFFGLTGYSASAVDSSPHTAVTAAAIPDCGNFGIGF